MNVWVEAFGAAQGGMLGLIVTMPIETVQKTQVFRVDVFLHACKSCVAACEAIRRSFARPCCTLMRHALRCMQCMQKYALHQVALKAKGEAGQGAREILERLMKNGIAAIFSC